MNKLIGFWLGIFCLSCAAQHRLLVSGCGYGDVAVYAEDGTKEWSCPEKREVSDAWLLPNNDISMSYKAGARVIRPDWKSGSGYDVVFDRPVAEGGETHTCMPLPGGGFLIGESFDGVSFIIELDDSFKETKRIELKDLGGKHTTFRQISKTPQGTYLITQQRNGGIAMEVSSDGEIIRRFPDGRYAALRLEDGNTLLACGDSHRILEVDPKDQIVWSLEQNDLPGISIGFVAGLQMLPNGNILFCNWGGHGATSGPSLIEVTPDKKMVWSASPGTPNRISNVKVLL
jgi:hypothetical protein